MKCNVLVLCFFSFIFIYVYSACEVTLSFWTLKLLFFLYDTTFICSTLNVKYTHTRIGH